MNLYLGINKRIRWNTYCSNINLVNIHEHKTKGKTNETYKFVPDFSESADLRC